MDEWSISDIRLWIKKRNKMAMTWMKLTSGKVWHLAHEMRDGLIQAKCGQVLDYGQVRPDISVAHLHPIWFCKRCIKYSKIAPVG